jgi:integrase/recombinase XerD
MARKFNEENERIKRRYLEYLREAKRSDMATVEKAAEAILRFERSTGLQALQAVSH